MNIIASRTSRNYTKIRKLRSDPRAVYFREYMSPVTYGTKLLVGVRPKHTKEEAERRYNAGWMGQIPYKSLAAHFRFESTFYYWANLYADRLMVMIDIDCHHGQGSYEGATKFANHLRNTLFPNLYFERSTNGNGVHGYFVIENPGLTWNQCDQLLKRVQNRLRAEATAVRADIGLVEIKGNPPELHTDGQWTRIGDKRYPPRTKILRFGQFAKVPRLGTNDKLAELRNTTRLTVAQIDGPQFDSPQAVLKKAKPKHLPSTAWTDENTAETISRYTSWARTQQLDNLKTSGRHLVKAEDFGVALYVLEKLGELMEPDAPMRTKRIKGMWTKLYRDGVASRGYDPKRFKVIRDTISERGLIDWSNNAYYPPVHQKGEAMMWRLGDDLLSELERRRTTLGGTTIHLTGPNEILYPEQVFRINYTALQELEQKAEDFESECLAA